MFLIDMNEDYTVSLGSGFSVNYQDCEGGIRFEFDGASNPPMGERVVVFTDRVFDENDQILSDAQKQTPRFWQAANAAKKYLADPKVNLFPRSMRVMLDTQQETS